MAATTLLSCSSLNGNLTRRRGQQRDVAERSRRMPASRWVVTLARSEKGEGLKVKMPRRLASRECGPIDAGTALPGCFSLPSSRPPAADGATKIPFARHVRLRSFALLLS